VFPNVGWPAVALAFVHLIGHVIHDKKAWWRLVFGLVVLAGVVVVGLLVLGVRVPVVPRVRAPATVTPSAIPVSHGAAPAPAATAQSVAQHARQRVYADERAQRRRVREGGPPTAGRPRVRPGRPSARVRPGRRPCRRHEARAGRGPGRPWSGSGARRDWPAGLRTGRPDPGRLQPGSDLVEPGRGLIGNSHGGGPQAAGGTRRETELGQLPGVRGRAGGTRGGQEGQ
jgi:hypothetical protein